MSFLPDGYFAGGFIPDGYFGEGGEDPDEPGTETFAGVPFTRQMEIMQGDDYTGARVLVITQEADEDWPDLTGEPVLLTAIHRVTGERLVNVAAVAVPTGDEKTIEVEITKEDNARAGLFDYNLETLDMTLRDGTLRVRWQVPKEVEE